MSKAQSIWTSLLIATLLLVTGSHFLSAEESGEVYQKSYEAEAKVDYDAALKVMKKMPKQEREGYIYSLRLGWLHYLNRQYGDSIKAYRAAIKANPKAIEGYLGLMLPQMAQRKWKAVVKTAQKALKIDPQNYLVNSRMAYAYYNMGNYKKAEAAYRKVVELYPSDTEMLAGLGWSLCKQGKDGRPYFQTILKFASKHPSARQGMKNCK